MITHLLGIIEKQSVGTLSVDVSGIGYAVSVPLPVWERVQDNEESKLYITSYIREDRFELYGFTEQSDRKLFETLIGLSGIGPRLGLDLCAVPKEIFLSAINENDPTILSSIKGIGKKTAEKLLIELKTIFEKQPSILSAESGTTTMSAHQYDKDAVSALESLGYDSQTILSLLKDLPEEITTTEQRVQAALQAM